MNQRDRKKIVDAGFTVIREREITLMGKQAYWIYASDRHNFNFHRFKGPFFSKKARKIRKETLLSENDRVIEET